MRQFIIKNRSALLSFQRNYSKVLVADLRVNDCIEYNGKPLIIQAVNSSQVGRGTRTFLLHLRDPSSATQTTLKPSPKDSFEKVELRDRLLTLLYSQVEVSGQGELIVMDGKSLEEVSLPLSLLVSPVPNGAPAGPTILPFLEGGVELRVRYWREHPVSIIPPRVVKCTVGEVLFVQETSENKNKKVTITTLNGARMTVPLKVEPGESILVNLEDYSYSGRP